jgi:hypothetical protein
MAAGVPTDVPPNFITSVLPAGCSLELVCGWDGIFSLHLEQDLDKKKPRWFCGALVYSTELLNCSCCLRANAPLYPP